MLPSMRVMVRLAKNSPKIQSRILEPTSTSRSRLVMPARCRGVMEALHPSTKKMLKRLLPITPLHLAGITNLDLLVRVGMYRLPQASAR